MTVPMMLIAAITVAYLCASVLLALLESQKKHASNDYLNATGSLPTGIATVSFLASNCGALEVLGISGLAARYGMQAFHFYWIGAVPAMIFVSFVTIPVYVRSGARSVPEYLGQRFGPRVRLFNACAILMSTAIYAGISLYALAEVMHSAAGWRFLTGVSAFAAIVLVYVLIGGFRATVYNEVLQFSLMFAGLAPVLYLTWQDRPRQAARVGEYWHAWGATPLFSQGQPLDLVAVVLGLGVVISFSYWCTDFGLVQRALTARTLESARLVPLFAGFGKLIFGFIVVLPVVMMSSRLHVAEGVTLDDTAPTMIAALYGPKFLCFGVGALVAGLLNSLAGNTSAFAALCTQEIYRPFLVRDREESHYVSVGRAASAVCIALGIMTAFATREFENLSAFVLLVFSLFVVPFFAVVLTGALFRRRNAVHALAGAGTGIVAGGLMHLAFAKAWVLTGSKLEANFYAAIVSFAAAIVVCNLPQSRSGELLRPALELRLASSDKLAWEPPSVGLWLLAGGLLALCVLLNVVWW